MKVLIYENDGALLQLISEAVINAGLEPETGETLDQLSNGGVSAAIISQEYTDWEDVFSAATEMNLPAYIAGKPELKTLAIIKNMNQGAQSGIITTFDERLAQEQTIRYLEKLHNGRQGGGLFQRQGISRKMPIPEPRRPSGPSPELQARRMRKKKNSDKDTVRDQIISVYSPKGGVGKTTFAVNAAYALSTCTNLNNRVILVDMDVSFGNVASVLNLPNKANLLNWIRGDFKENLADLVHVHQESGLHILMAPPNPVDAGDINYQTVDKMLAILSKRYDFVVIDTNPALRALHKACFEWSDTIVLVATPQKPTLRDVKQMEHIFKQIQIPYDKVKLVVNGVPKKQSMRIKDALQEMCFETLGFIPDDPNVKVLENFSGIACLSGKCKDYSRAHFTICNRLLGKEILEHPKSFNLLKFFSRKPKAAF